MFHAGKSSEKLSWVCIQLGQMLPLLHLPRLSPGSVWADPAFLYLQILRKNDGTELLKGLYPCSIVDQYLFSESFEAHGELQGRRGNKAELSATWG